MGAETVLTGLTRHFETNSASMKEVLLDLEIAASHDVTVLLIGETGGLARRTFRDSSTRCRPDVTNR
jgi:transcriptional regulator with GAF, ATPase, and Fis domain